jgi:o-succinylbenzoate synthase
VRLALSVSPYRLPLRRPWRSARDRLENRSGWLVTAAMDGCRGYGDCAPLPAAGTETPAVARAQLARWRETAASLRCDDPLEHLLKALGRPSASPAPAADCAVECALLDLQARRAGIPLRQLLAGSAADQVAVNAMLGEASQVTPDAIRDAVAQGFRVLKLKVGIAVAAVELARLDAVGGVLPAGSALRLDANGAWEMPEAARFIAGLRALPIESLEEPLTRPTDTLLARLQQAAGFSIALDESLARWPSPLSPRSLPVRRLVLKPGVVGGLRRTLTLARGAQAAGREVVLTGLVESAAGIWATSQLAAAVGSTLAHGLATGTWLARDLGTAPCPVGGRLVLPERPGSGFEPSMG